MTLTLRVDDPVARALVAAIRGGDLASLVRLLGEHPDAAGARIANPAGASRTPLHVATDWPGFFPNGPAVVAALVAAGADPDARKEGRGAAETPLHWAASSDDAEVADALIAGGADLEAPGASIAGGTALDNAVGYGCWNVARLLVARGARVGKLWHAAALGMTARVAELLDAPAPPRADELNDAFWQACHGGQRRTAEYLLARGADPTWVPAYAKRTPREIAGALDTGRESLVTWLREQVTAAPPRPA